MSFFFSETFFSPCSRFLCRLSLFIIANFSALPLSSPLSINQTGRSSRVCANQSVPGGMQAFSLQPRQRETLRSTARETNQTQDPDSLRGPCQDRDHPHSCLPVGPQTARTTADSSRHRAAAAPIGPKGRRPRSSEGG